MEWSTRASSRSVEYGIGIPARPDLHDSHARVDRQFGAGESEGDLFRGDGLVHQSCAFALSQLGTKYLNQAFVVTREVRDAATNMLQTPEDYSQLGTLFVVQMVLGLALPFAAILFARLTRFRSA